jgi:hypothetical protein
MGGFRNVARPLLLPSPSSENAVSYSVRCLLNNLRLLSAPGRRDVCFFDDGDLKDVPRPSNECKQRIPYYVLTMPPGPFFKVFL